jgi:hypothetical protein
LVRGDSGKRTQDGTQEQEPGRAAEAQCCGVIPGSFVHIIKPGKALNFFPEIDRAYCRLMVYNPDGAQPGTHLDAGLRIV